MRQFVFSCVSLVVLAFSLPVLAAAERSVVPSETEIRETLSLGSRIWGGFPAIPDEGTQFYQSLGYLLEGESLKASQSFAELRSRLDAQGYRNAPEFSFELLRSAVQSKERGRPELVMPLVNFAKLLSPKHPRVSLAVASLYADVGLSRSAEELFKAASLLPSYPLVLLTLLLNLGVVLSVSLGLALLFVSVVQLLRGGEVLIKQLGRAFPRPVAGLFGTLLLPVLLVGPLFLGVLAALAVWSVLLGFYRPACRYYAFAVGALILLWSWLIPNARILGIQTQLSYMQALEDINAGNFNPTGEERLLALARKESPSPAALFGAALVAQQGGQSAVARGYYRVLDTMAAVLPKSFVDAVSLNRGVLLYREQNYAEAQKLFEELEQSGVASFELLHNRALVHMGMLEPERYREYYERARALDAERQDLLMLAAVDGVADPIAAQLDREAFWALIARSASPSAVDSARAEALAASMLRGGSPRVLELLAGLTLLLGVFALLSSMKNRRRRRHSTAFVTNGVQKRQDSLLWCILPAGYAIAGKYPLSGACYLSVVIAAVVIAFGAPMHLFSVLPLQAEVSSPFLTLAIALLLFSMTWSLALFKRSTGLED